MSNHGLLSLSGLEEYTVEDIAGLLTRENISKEIIKSFTMQGIRGSYFAQLSNDMLKELGVISELDKMKIKTLVQELSRSKQS